MMKEHAGVVDDEDKGLLFMLSSISYCTIVKKGERHSTLLRVKLQYLLHS